MNSNTEECRVFGTINQAGRSFCEEERRSVRRRALRGSEELRIVGRNDSALSFHRFEAFSVVFLVSGIAQRQFGRVSVPPLPSFSFVSHGKRRKWSVANCPVVARLKTFSCRRQENESSPASPSRLRRPRRHRKLTINRNVPPRRHVVDRRNLLLQVLLERRRAIHFTCIV